MPAVMPNAQAVVNVSVAPQEQAQELKPSDDQPFKKEMNKQLSHAALPEQKATPEAIPEPQQQTQAGVQAGSQTEPPVDPALIASASEEQTHEVPLSPDSVAILVQDVFRTGFFDPYSLIETEPMQDYSKTASMLLTGQFYSVLMDQGVLGEGEGISGHQHATELMQEMRYKLADNPEQLQSLVKSLVNEYNLNFGNPELDALNGELLAMESYVPPEDIGLIRDAFQGNLLMSDEELKAYSAELENSDNPNFMNRFLSGIKNIFTAR